MKRKQVKVLLSLTLALIIAITSGISAFAVSGVWEYYDDIPHNIHYKYQAEYYPTNNFAQVIVRSGTTNGAYVSPYYMFIQAYIINQYNFTMTASSPLLYNTSPTSSMSTQATVTTAGLYHFCGYAGYYKETNNEGNRVYTVFDADAETHMFVPGSYSSSTPSYGEMEARTSHINTRGKTYGVLMPGTDYENYPDYIKATGDHNRIGYVASEDLLYTPKSEAEIISYMESIESGEGLELPLYDLEGNVIDSFTLSMDGIISYDD